MQAIGKIYLVGFAILVFSTVGRADTLSINLAAGQDVFYPDSGPPLLYTGGAFLGTGLVEVTSPSGTVVEVISWGASPSGTNGLPQFVETPDFVMFNPSSAILTDLFRRFGTDAVIPETVLPDGSTYASCTTISEAEPGCGFFVDISRLHFPVDLGGLGHTPTFFRYVYFGNPPAPTPEPPVFVLFGAALVSLAGLHVFKSSLSAQ